MDNSKLEGNIEEPAESNNAPQSENLALVVLEVKAFQVIAFLKYLSPSLYNDKFEDLK